MECTVRKGVKITLERGYLERGYLERRVIVERGLEKCYWQKVTKSFTLMIYFMG